MGSVSIAADHARGGTAETVYPDWRAALADVVRGGDELCRLLGLPPALAAAAERAGREFSVVVPRTFLARIRPDDPNDPLLAQILPKAEELTEVAQFRADPLGEAQAAPSPGLLRKYHGRILIVATPVCAVHCRFCFRRHFPYDESPRKALLWDRALAMAAGDPSIDEVILSGGDPLSLDDAELAQFARRLAEIPHVSRLRIHTRFPVVIPQRVTNELTHWLTATRLTPIVVMHINHPQEINAALATALGRLVRAGIVVLNQAVLLRGVNDRAEVLEELCRRLVDLRVMPYYLHQLDRVAGAAHFEVPEAAGVELVRTLRTRLPGYAVPRYVRETPGGQCKELLD